MLRSSQSVRRPSGSTFTTRTYARTHRRGRQMFDKPVRNTKSWRGRALKARLTAKQISERDSKRMLNEFADIYEQLAEQTEHRARAAEDAMRRARERHRRINTGRDDRVRSH